MKARRRHHWCKRPEMQKGEQVRTCGQVTEGCPRAGSGRNSKLAACRHRKIVAATNVAGDSRHQ